MTSRNSRLRNAVFTNLDVAFNLGQPLFDYGDADLAQRIIDASRGSYTVPELLPHVIEWKGKKFRELIELLKTLKTELDSK